MRTGSLFLKYAIPLILLSSGAVIVSALDQMYFSYQENKTALARIQHEKAVAASIRIEQFARDLEHQVAWIAQAPWGPRGITLDQRRLDSLRLLRQVPAITEVSHLDPEGHEQLRVSRLAMDVLGSNTDYSLDPKFTETKRQKTYFSPVYFRKESEPYITIALVGSGENPGVVAAEANLKFIWDVVSAMKVGQGGHAYVVDAKGRLIAHPDISLVLQNTDLSFLAIVRAAVSQGATNESSVEAVTGLDVQGREVLSTSAPVQPLGWTVFVDLPLKEAFAPLYSSLARTGLLLLVGLAVSTLASLVLVRRMIAPIHVLQTGAARIGAGALDQRIEVNTGDELQTLGEEFNLMAERLQESYAGLERKVEARTRDLTESLEQQTATSEILRVISRSQRDVQPVFEAIAANAQKLCEGSFSGVWTYDGELIHLQSVVGFTSNGAEAMRQTFPRRPGYGGTNDRAILTGAVVYLPDVLEDKVYELQRLAREVGFRSMLSVPMLKDGRPIGTIGVSGAEPEMFSRRQIAMLETFADQAVIAIENTRLFKELEERNKALTEALDYQTATSDVLKAISRTTFDLDAVLTTLVTTVMRLCQAEQGGMFRLDEGVYRWAAGYGVGEEYLAIERSARIKPGRGSVVGRAALERQTVQIVDAWNDPEYEIKDEAKVGGVRSMLGVPLMRDSMPIGVFSLARNRVEPFTQKQVELVTTFADQAVIAIENVRLFQELQSRTRELGRSVEQLRSLAGVSQAVNSTIDLDQVLSTIVEQAVQLSSADGGAAYEFNEATGEFHPRATYGFPQYLVDILLATPLRIGEGATGRAAEKRAPVQIPDLRVEGAYAGPLQKATMQAGALAVLAIPLMREERILGSLVVSRNSVGEFPTEIVDLLQTFAAQSTLAIQNARLFREIEQKGRELQVASQHKSQFLANMSHELRTPLNAILGYTELIVDGIYGEVPQKIRDVQERVQKSGRHLLGLINDVLDLSKIEAGQLVLALSDYSLNDVVQTVITSVESLVAEKGLLLTADVAPGLPVGRGDERRITQVLLNLVGNAIKFTDKGKVLVTVTVDDGKFVISVEDTGPGIPVAEQERIFEEFRQVDSSSTRAKGGTGLGLAIARRIVDLHRGRIWAESAIGAGSTFFISIPIKADLQGSSS